MSFHDIASIAALWVVASCGMALLIGHLIRKGRGQAKELGPDDPSDDVPHAGPLP